MRVLVVDDHLPTIELMNLTLTAFGHSVVSATNLIEALDQVATSRPEVVLSDLTFSSAGGDDQDGYALARAMRADPTQADVTLLAISGVTSQTLVQKAIESGFNDVVVKPFDVVALIERIEAVGAGGQP